MKLFWILILSVWVASCATPDQSIVEESVNPVQKELAKDQEDISESRAKRFQKFIEIMKKRQERHKEYSKRKTKKAKAL